MSIFGGRGNNADRLVGIRLTSSVLGTVRKILMGTGRTSSSLLWYGDFQSNKAKQQGGKGIAKGGSQYVYSASVLAALAEGPLRFLLNVYDSTGRFVLESGAEPVTIPSGGGSYQPLNASNFGTDQGVALQQAYSVTVDDFGSPGSVTLSGTQGVPMTAVPFVATQVADPLTNFLDPAWNMNVGSFDMDFVQNAIKVATQAADQKALMGWSGITVPAAMFAQLKIVATDASTAAGIGPAVNVASGVTESYYGFHYTGTPATAVLFKNVAGTVTILQTISSVTCAVGDIIRLENDGSGHLKGYKNGTLIASATDTSLTGGTVGIESAIVGTAWRANNFSGGGLNAPTLTAGQYSVNPTTGFYYFSAADATKQVVVNYAFYRYQIVTEQRTIIPASPGPYTITVDNNANFKKDQGVAFYPSGVALKKITSGTPTTGQYKVSGATYTFAAADTQQPIIISYTYNDPNTDSNAPTTLNMSLVSGAKSQAPVSYMTGKHPDQALGYTELAYIFSSGMFLGYSPELPNYSYEVAGPYQWGGGIVDANPADCILAMLTNTAWGLNFPQQFIGDLTQAALCSAANGYFISPVIENQSSCASIMAPWLEAGQIAAFFSEAQLKFVPYCDTSAVGNGATYIAQTTPVATLTDDDFVPGQKGNPSITMSRSDFQDAWNKVTVVYNARVNDYNPVPCPETDEASIQKWGERPEDPQQWDFIKTLAAAQYAASLRVQRFAYIRNTYNFRLPDSFTFLEPADVVTVTNTIMGLNAKAVRITKIEDDGNGLNVTAEEFIWGTAAPAYNPKDANQPYIAELGQQDPGNTNAIIFEAPDPLGLFKGNKIYGFANGSNPNWGGCDVWVSVDGENYGDTPLVRIQNPGRLGVLTQNLAAYSSANPDTTNTLQTKMTVAGSVIPQATTLQATTNTSLCALLDAAGNLELLTYVNSVLAGTDLYNLTTLYRGLLGTTGRSHNAGELFARLDDASFIEEYSPSYYGKTIFFKFTSFNLLGNQEQSLANVEAFPLTILGTGKGAVGLDTGYLNIQAPGYTQYRPTSNPLTAHDTGTDATINVAAFDILLSGYALPLSYNSGAITGLAYGTLYFVYFDDIAETGGTVAYQVTTNKPDVFSAVNRFFVGSIVTPASGAADTIGFDDGGNGGAYGMKIQVRPTTFSTFTLGTATAANEGNMFDGDENSFATLTMNGTGVNSKVQVSLLNFPVSQRFSNVTLAATWAVPTNTLTGGNGPFNIQASLQINNDSLVTPILGTIFSALSTGNTQATPVTTMLDVIPGTDLSRFANSATGIWLVAVGLNPIPHYATSGTCVVHVYEVYFLGDE